MTWLEALLLGIVEGLTEFLPVSSTGHLEITNALLGHGDAASKTMSVVIQLGAVLAVLGYYRATLVDLAKGVLARDPAKLRLLAALAIAFVPAAALGFVAHDAIKRRLFGPVPVGYALIVGGVAMIVVEAAHKRLRARSEAGLERVTPFRALVIGLAQCFSLWPGMSRSMTTIVGAQLSGLDTPTAAEFSFLLSIPVLGAATLYDLKKDGAALFAMKDGGFVLGVGLASAFVVSMAAVSGFLRYLKKYGLLPFGVYRIAVGGLVLWLVSRGVLGAH
jgi:undecaprenyl-diphosphatase